MPGETITKAEIKTLIKEEKIQPSDLFDNDALINDTVVKTFVKESVKEGTTGEYVRGRKKEEGFDKKSAEWEEKDKEKDEEIKKLKIKDAKRDAVDLFTAKIKERKLDKKEAAFIESKQDKFEPEDLENVPREVDKYMDDKIEEFKETAKIFGVKTEKGEEKEEIGSPPGEEKQDENSLIPD